MIVCISEFKSNMYWFLQGLIYRILSASGKKFNSQSSFVFKFMLLPLTYCYRLDIMWNLCIQFWRTFWWNKTLVESDTIKYKIGFAESSDIITYPTSHGILQLIQQPAMGYGDLSHAEVIISHEAKLSGIYETEVWDKLISHGWLLHKYFILSKGNFKQNKTLKNLAMGYGNLFNDHQPIRTRQISLK